MHDWFSALVQMLLHSHLLSEHAVRRRKSSSGCSEFVINITVSAPGEEVLELSANLWFAYIERERVCAVDENKKILSATVTIIVATFVWSILPPIVAARVLVPGLVILTIVGPLPSCMVYPRIVVVVMIAKTIMNSKTSRCGISGTAGAGVVGVLLHCLHVGGVLCGFDRRTAYLGLAKNHGRKVFFSFVR